MEPVGLGFAGVGWLGESLIKELPAFPSLRLAAVQDANTELVAEVAARYASPWQGASYEAMLGAPGVDAVVICTPNSFHVPQTRAALGAGKHVLVQKPLAFSAADARAVVAFAQAQGRVLLVDYSYRFLETTRVFQQRVAQLGAVTGVQGVFHNIWGPGKAWFFDPKVSGGGALMDLGVHLIDLALETLHPRTVRLDAADLGYDQGHAVENRASLRLLLDEVPCAVEVSWNAPLPRADISLQVDGERGSVRWENVDGSFFRFRTVSPSGEVLLDRETPLRTDTLAAFVKALQQGSGPTVHAEVYDLLEQAKLRAAS